MATGMKTWLGIVAGVCALVAVWLLPPEAPRTLGELRRLPEQIPYEAVQSEMSRLHGVLVANRTSDALVERAFATEVDGVATGVSASLPIPAEEVEVWDTEVRRRLTSGPRDPDMLVGLFIQDAAEGLLADVPAPPRRTGQTFVGTRGGRPYCLEVRTVHRTSRGGLTLYPGTCSWYAHHGLPGAGIASWIEAGALRFGEGLRVPRIDPVDVSAKVVFGRLLVDMAGDDWFGSLRGPSPPATRCLGGDPSACVERVMDPTWLSWLASRNSPGPRYVVEHSALTHFESLGYSGGLDAYLFAEMQETFGDDAFRRFWTSDAPVPEAFESAFGAPLGTWLMQREQATYGVWRAGPGLSRTTFPSTIAAVSFLAALTCLVGVRRRVA